MKKLFKAIVWVLILATIISSCSSNDSAIIRRGIDTQSHWQSVSGPGSPNIQVFDSLYKVQPNFAEKKLLAEHMHTIIWFWALLGLGAAIIALGLYEMSQTKGSYAQVAIIFAGMAIALGGVGSIDWAHSKEYDIEKSVYETEMQTYGNLHHWWVDEGNLYK